MAKYNWTTEDIGHLLATYPGFEHLKFKLINVSKNHVNQLGNITYEIFEIMQKRICLNGKQSSPMLTLEYLMKTCISIRCSLDSEESSSRVVSYLSVRNNMGNKEASNLRMLIINHMRETHGLDLTTRYQAYLLSHGSYVKLTPLQMTPYNIIFVHPLKVNIPTTKCINCRKKICSSQEQKHPCSNVSEVILQESGIGCFEWWYTVSPSPIFDYGPRKKNPLSDEFNLLMLIYPPYQMWKVCEHKPIFFWYQTLSNIGGTLSIWTGASVLSFLHLLEVFCYKCYRRQCKVGDSSQIADIVV